MARIRVRKGDVLIIDGLELDGATLRMILKPEARVLWAFLRNKSGDIQPVPYDENHVIWLQENDLERTDAEQTQ